MEKVIFNAGQRKTYKEGEKPIVFPQMPYTPAEVINDMPPLVVHPKFAEKNYVVTVDVTEFIPDVTAEMIDWWWANMEKGYPLWAPGEHYGFDWIVPPCEVGYEGSVEASYEFDPHHPILLTRMGMHEYPFTECFEHCWMAAGNLGPVKAVLIHMYENVEGGIRWRSVEFATKEMADLKESIKNKIPDTAPHMAYESGRLKDFLPMLYKLWQGHPDPWQNVQYDLTAKKNEDGTWVHVHKNLAPEM